MKPGALALAVALAAGLLPASAGGPRAAARAGAAGDPVRGVIISTHIDGTDWGNDSMVSTMRDIRALGANWIAIHPYAMIRANGALRFRPLDPGAPPAWLVRPIREAHALGLKVLIKPHVAYWGSPFRWRGEIAFTRDAEWERFWRDYERWITGLAAACRGADGFVVGTELMQTLRFEDAWRRIIAAVRARTTAPLTYAANWTVYDQVTFWDALDVIGIQAYFPLTGESRPDAAAIERGWAARMAELRRFAAEQQRSIVFAELGYNRSFDAPVRPWTYEVDGREAEPLQATCVQLALQAVEREPSVIGVFLWKWFPNPYPVGHNFQLATPRLKRAIRSVWSRPQGESP